MEWTQVRLVRISISGPRMEIGGEIRELLVRSDFILLRGTTEKGKSGRVLVVWAVRLGATPESLGVLKSRYQSC